MKHRNVIQQLVIFAGFLILAVLSCSGTSEIPNLIASKTSTPTNTFTPSPTSTPSPAATGTRTPSPTPLPTGVSVEEQTDGTTLFIDHDNKYQLLLPADWAVVISTQKELQQAIQDASNEEPAFAEMAESFKGMNPDIFRLAAMNDNLKYIRASSPTLLTINTFEDPIAGTMPMAYVTALIEDNILEGATSTTWDVIDNENDVEVGIVRGERLLQAPDGRSLNVQELVIAFQANKKLVLMEIVAPQEYGEEILSPFEDLINSTKVDVK